MDHETKNALEVLEVWFGRDVSREIETRVRRGVYSKDFVHELRRVCDAELARGA